MGTTCAQILQMTSSEWIAKITSMDDSQEDGQLRGIESYGRCYDERTDRFAASLARSRKGPSLHARRDFSDLMAALDDFTAKALVDSQPPGDELKKAYAGLYEKEFRYEFYQSYAQKASTSKHPKAAASTPASEPATTPKTAPGANATAAGAKAPKTPVSEMTLAKNQFGELLDAMPPDKLHEIHAAFGKVIELRPIASAPELAIYRYAIFVLSLPHRVLARRGTRLQPSRLLRRYFDRRVDCRGLELDSPRRIRPISKEFLGFRRRFRIGGEQAGDEGLEPRLVRGGNFSKLDAHPFGAHAAHGRAAAYLPSGTESRTVSTVPRGAGSSVEMKSPPTFRSLTRDTLCLTLSPCHATQMPFGV